LKRLQLIQTLFEKTNFKTYLEIGCYKGKTFFPVRAKRKIAVDPFFHPFFIKDAIFTIIRRPQNLTNRYFKETSDRFFMKQQSFLNKTAPLDVVFVDGLHTYEAALKDVLHALKYLSENGVIIMHDCFPPNQAAALATKDYPTMEERKKVEGFTGAWCGDVWKAVVYLRRHLSDILDVSVINSDNGLGIVRTKKKLGDKVFCIDKKLFLEIDALTYNELVENADVFLNLIASDQASTIIDNIVAKANS